MTNLVLKKHYTQFDSKEIDYCFNFCKNFKVNGYCEHFTERYFQKGIHSYFPFNEIESLVKKYGFVVEAKLVVKHNNERYTIRINKNVGGKNLVLVVDTNGILITVWLNNINDNHSTLDISKYTTHLHLC